MLTKTRCKIAQYYAAKLAIARGPRTKETTDYLSHLLDALETVSTYSRLILQTIEEC